MLCCKIVLPSEIKFTKFLKGVFVFPDVVLSYIYWTNSQVYVSHLLINIVHM